MRCTGLSPTAGHLLVGRDLQAHEADRLLHEMPGLALGRDGVVMKGLSLRLTDTRQDIGQGVLPHALEGFGSIAKSFAIGLATLITRSGDLGLPSLQEGLTEVERPLSCLLIASILISSGPTAKGFALKGTRLRMKFVGFAVSLADPVRTNRSPARIN